MTDPPEYIAEFGPPVGGGTIRGRCEDDDAARRAFPDAVAILCLDTDPPRYIRHRGQDL